MTWTQLRGGTKNQREKKNHLKINTILCKKSYYYIHININVLNVFSVYCPFFIFNTRIIFKSTAKIVYYFEVRVTQCLILEVNGDMNQKRLRTIAIINL